MPGTPVTEPTGRDHYEIAEAMLDRLGGERDVEWAKVMVARAHVHAQLAQAAPIYGKHFARKEPVVLDEVTAQTHVNVIDIFTKRDQADLAILLGDDDE